MALVRSKEGNDMINLFKFIILLSLGVVIAIFSYQNMTPVEVNVYKYTYSIPVFILIFGCFIVGFIIPAVYYYFKNMHLSYDLNNMQKIFGLYGRGYLINLLNILRKNLRNKPIISIFASNVYIKANKIDEGIRFFESFKQHNASAFSELALAQLYFKKGMYEEALMCLRQSISYDFKNLRAHRLLRNISFVKGNLPEAIASQRNILKIVEKEFSQMEGKIMGNLLAYASLKEKNIKEREKLVRESLRYVKNPLSMTANILLNIEKGKEANAEQILEESFNNNMQDHVLALLLNYKDKLPYFLNIIKEKEGKINLEILTRVYIALNVFEPLKERIDVLPDHLKAMVETGESHIERDKLCFKALSGIYKLWECQCCGSLYEEYKPLCERCFEWNCIDLINARSN